MPTILLDINIFTTHENKSHTNSISSYAAKSADEIGRIAAGLAGGNKWLTNIPREAMMARWRKARKSKKTKKDKEDARRSNL